MTDLSALIARIEAATGPSIELDEAIRLAIGAESIHYGSAEGLVTTDECYGPPSYTESIDAALTLAPEGQAWSLGRWNSQSGDGPTVFWFDLHGREEICARHPIHAIAVCISCLKARQP